MPGPAAAAELHWRIAPPLLALAFALLAVPLARSSPRQARYGSILLAFLAYLVGIFMMMLGTQWLAEGSLPVAFGPVVAAAADARPGHLAVCPRRPRGQGRGGVDEALAEVARQLHRAGGRRPACCWPGRYCSGWTWCSPSPATSTTSARAATPSTTRSPRPA
jgi:hypothetical protein